MGQKVREKSLLFAQFYCEHKTAQKIKSAKKCGNDFGTS